MPKKEKKEPSVHHDLKGFDIHIDRFGELKSTMSIDQINEFLNRNVEDKKLEERKDIDQIKEKGKFKN